RKRTCPAHLIVFFHKFALSPPFRAQPVGVHRVKRTPKGRTGALPLATAMLEVELPTLLRSADGASAQQREQLFAALYDELHRMAQRELRRNAAVTLSPTTLLHEAYLNISKRDSAPFEDRAKFMAYAAR